MPSRSIYHMVSYDKIFFFLWLSNISSYKSIYVRLYIYKCVSHTCLSIYLCISHIFIPSALDEYSGCFHVLAAVNSAVGIVGCRCLLATVTSRGRVALPNSGRQSICAENPSRPHSRRLIQLLMCILHYRLYNRPVNVFC